MRKILFPLAFIFQFALAQQAEVTNVTAAQRTDGSKLVDITYDITEDSLFTSFNVSVEVSFDGGATYTQTNYVDGDVGGYIISGTGRHITWYLGNEYPDVFFEDMKVKVIANGYITEELPFEFVTVPAGEYTFGQGDTVLTIDYDFEFMKYEVTNAQYVEFLIEAFETGEVWFNDGNEWLYGFYFGDEHNSGGDYILYYLGEPESSQGYNYGRISWNGTIFIVTEGYGDHPVVHVTWFGAFKFAEHYGLRLPTEHEWEKTARGNTGYGFPWGGDIDDSRANYQNSGDPWETGSTPVGFYNGQNYEGFQTTDSPSQFGAYDMGGNVWEWTHSWHHQTNSRLYRGGGYTRAQYWCHAYNMTVSGLGFTHPGSATYDFGFRCVRTISE